MAKDPATKKVIEAPITQGGFPPMGKPDPKPDPKPQPKK